MQFFAIFRYPLHPCKVMPSFNIGNKWKLVLILTLLFFA